MNKISTFALATTVTGAFIGAGFVSGQELWQFFGKYSLLGLLGFLIASILIITLSMLTIRFAQKYNKGTFSEIVCISQNRFLKVVTEIFEYVFYISICIIMTAGAEAILFDLFGINKSLTGILFISVSAAVVLTGAKGITRAFSFVVPLLIISVLIISFWSIKIVDFRIPISAEKADGSFFSSALLYVSYNFFAAIGVLTSLSKAEIKKTRLTISGIVSLVFFLLFGTSIILSTFATKNASNSELPMLLVSETISHTTALIYSLLMILAMFCATVTSFFPVVESLDSRKQKTPIRLLACFLISLVTLVLSGFGFSELINTIYPFFGYVGFAIIGTLLYNFLLKKM